MPQSTGVLIGLGRRRQELVYVVPSESSGNDLVLVVRNDNLLLVKARL